VAVAQGSGALHRYAPLGIGHIFTIRSSTVNLSSRAFYRHDDRHPLPADLVVTPLIKTLRGG
jgi:hypothetical protein